MSMAVEARNGITGKKKQEMKVSYKRKQVINAELYKINLYKVNTCNNIGTM
jgi:hypothetical protein